jgi:hypothetical protein
MFVARKTRAAAAPPAASTSPPLTKQEKEMIDALQSHNVMTDSIEQAMQNSCGVSNNNLHRGNSCGARAPGPCGLAPCGGLTPGSGGGLVTAPDVRVELGLEPKPGLSQSDVIVAKRAISMFRAKVASCLRSDTSANGPSAKLSMSIDIHADGVAAPTTVFAKSGVDPQTETCIRSMVTHDLSGDTTPAALSFPIWFDIVKK